MLRQFKTAVSIAITALIVLAIIAGCSGPGNSNDTDENASQESTAQIDSESETTQAESNVELKATTQYLEYSNKTVDPETLVKASDTNAQVSTKDTIDLSIVGTQNVTYTIIANGKETTQTLEFTVRDTKAPTITLASTNPNVEQGGTFDLQSAIAGVADEIDGSLNFVEAVPEKLPGTASETKGKRAGTEQIYDAGWYTFEGAADYGTPGTYPITVKAADKHGNSTTKELNVTVVAPAQPEPEVTPAPTPAPAAATSTYILNTNTGKFHIPGCRAVKQMKESNKREVNATRAEVIAQGYDPCGICHP